MRKVKCLIRGNLLNIVLFLLTVVSTLFAGTIQSGGNPFKNIASLRLGIPFSFTLLSILLFHEFAHYFAARAHKTKTTLPYFIPAPTFLGTFGAVIKIKTPIQNRNALLDIGIAGPAASFIVSIIAVVAGLSASRVVCSVPEGSMNLGNSVIFAVLSRMVKGEIPAGHDIMLNPVAFAGWIGFFITAMNLIPAAQLDGGHISYALLGKRHALVARGVFLTLICFGLIWLGWIIWAMLIIVFGLGHPAPVDDVTPLNRKRKLIGIAGFIILILTFVPCPFM